MCFNWLLVLQLSVVFRALLILDDIWDSTVLKAFDIHCRILLTTRNRSITDAVSGMNPVLVNIHMQINFKIKMEIIVVAVKNVLRVHILKHFLEALNMKLKWRVVWMNTKRWRFSHCTLRQNHTAFLRRLRVSSENVKVGKHGMF